MEFNNKQMKMISNIFTRYIDNKNYQINLLGVSDLMVVNNDPIINDLVMEKLSSEKFIAEKIHDILILLDGVQDSDKTFASIAGGFDGPLKNEELIDYIDVWQKACTDYHRGVSSMLLTSMNIISESGMTGIEKQRKSVFEKISKEMEESSNLQGVVSNFIKTVSPKMKMK